MKIFIAHYSSSTDISGVSNWLIEFVRYFRDKHELFVYLRHDNGPIDESIFALWLDELNVPYRLIPKQDNIHKDISHLLETIKDVQPDVFLPQCVHSNFIAGVIAGQAGLPWIMTMHSDGEDYWSFYREFDPAQYSGSTVSVSKYIGEKTVQYTRQNTPVVIPCGVKPTELKSTWNDTVFRVVYSGRLEIHPKRADLILDVMIELCIRHPQIECVLIGDGPYRPTAEKRVEDSGLSGKISFTGRVNHDEVIGHLQKSHVFIMMSEYEGLPVSLIEAMECGVVPVVRKISSGVTELVLDGQNGYLTGTNVMEIVDKVNILADNKDQWISMSEASKQTINPDYLECPNLEKWDRLLNSISAVSSQNVSFEQIQTTGFDIPKVILNWNQTSRSTPLQHVKQRIGALLRFGRSS